MDLMNLANNVTICFQLNAAVHAKQCLAGTAQGFKILVFIVRHYVETGSSMREKLVMLLMSQMTILMDVMHLAKQFKAGTAQMLL